MSAKTLNISVVVADRTYRMKVSVSEEEKVRKAASLIRHKMKELQGKYNAKDKQDYLAMSALLICVDLLRKETALETEDFELSDKINHLDKLINEFVNKG